MGLLLAEYWCYAKLVNQERDKLQYMTLILGTNLSDRVLLGADTRVSKSDGSKDDHVIKIIPLYGNNVAGRDDGFGTKTSLAVAGSVDFCSFLYKNIDAALGTNQLMGDIRSLHATALDLVRGHVDTWLKNGGGHRNACLLFGGVIPTKTKDIPPKQIQNLLSNFGSTSVEQERKLVEIENLITTDPVWKAINEKVMQDAGSTAIDIFKMGQIPKIPERLEQILEGKTSKVRPDSLVFAILIDTKRGAFDVQKADWGELLAFGTNGITKNYIPTELLSKLEFQSGKEKNQLNLMETAMISLTIEDLGTRFGGGAIGGTVFVNALSENANTIHSNGQDCEEKNGKLFYKKTTPPIQIVPFHKYLATLSSSNDTGGMSFF